MSSPYDPIYINCIASAQTEIRALEAEKKSIEGRLRYIYARERRLRIAIEALEAVIAINEDAALPANKSGETA